MNGQLTRVSILSGVLWGLAAAMINAHLFNARFLEMRNLLPFGLTGALVGLMTGFVLQRVPRKEIWAPAVEASVITLLVTTIVFSILVTTATTAIEILRVGQAPPTATMKNILQAPIWWLYGLFASGSVVVLWPLAVLNHLWFFRIRDGQRQSTSAS